LIAGELIGRWKWRRVGWHVVEWRRSSDRTPSNAWPRRRRTAGLSWCSSRSRTRRCRRRAAIRRTSLRCTRHVHPRTSDRDPNGRTPGSRA
jgi:hypothetical protein